MNTKMMNMDISIRYAKISDADALALIYSSSYQTAFKGLIPDSILEDVFSVKKRKEGLSREISSGVPVNAIMFYENEPIGLLTFSRSKDEDLDDSCYEILRLYILPEYWGMKMGERFIKWALEELKQRNCSRASLWVIEDNSRGRRLYERTGFIHDGVTRIIDVGNKLRDLRYIISL